MCPSLVYDDTSLYYLGDLKPRLHLNNITENFVTDIFCQQCYNKCYKHNVQTKIEIWKQTKLFPTFNFGLEIPIFKRGYKKDPEK